MRRALIKRNAPSFPSCVYLSIPRVFRVYADHLRALFFPFFFFLFSPFFFFRLPRSATTVFSYSPMSSRGHVSQLASAGIMVFVMVRRACHANLHAACDGATRLILVPCDRRGNLYRRDLGCAVFLLDLGMKKEIFGYNIGWV